MQKRLFLILAAAAVLLAACSPGGSTAPGGAMACEIVQLLPEPDPALQAIIPDVQSDDHVLGNADAPVTLIEYSDFQCPYCAYLSPIIRQLVEEYPDDVRVALRYFPLSIHSNAYITAQAAEAAGLQGKFQEMDEAIFAGQEEWASLSEEDATTWLLDKGESLGLDRARLESDMASQAVIDRVNRNAQEATDAQLPGTPFLFINGLPYQADMSLTALSGLVELVKLQDSQYTSCPDVIIDQGKQYMAELSTSKGDVTIQLYADKAPLAVNSFVFLAREGFFDGVSFHRVLPGFVAQAGDPSGSGYGGPGYQFANENADAKFDRPGLVAMANSGAGTNGSQFFITYAEVENLNGGYTIFGEVTGGLDVVEQFTPRDPQAGGELPDGDRILSVNIIESE